MNRTQTNILFLRITLILMGVIVLIGSLHLKSDGEVDLISKVKVQQKELAEELAKKYDAVIFQNKFNQQQLIDKIIPLNKTIVADSVVKDFYQKGKDVFIILKINSLSENIYAKLKCNYSTINEYFKLKSNKVLAVFKPEQILYNQPFYESERMNGKPLVLSGKKEILITGNCLELVEYPTYLVDG